MKKIDIKKQFQALYSGPVGGFIVLEVPPLRYFMIDGSGDPNTAPSYRAAIEALFTISYTLKFIAKNELGTDYIVPPLEGLWWAEDPKHFISRMKDKWSWTMMTLVPDFIEDSSIEKAFRAAREKKNNPDIQRVRVASLNEGQVVQTLHIGPYDAEGPILKKMHEEFVPANNFALTGIHHEIYLSDPRRTAAEKLKTVLRQPVKRLK